MKETGVNNRDTTPGQHPLKPWDEPQFDTDRGQKILPGGGGGGGGGGPSHAGQEADKLILPEMPLPDELPADDGE